jgi:NAD(P)-dependent dehydrogenase (short-subunit alcohol dehydrogenase family)
MNLAGKVIIVTGAAQGIGLAIAERCADSGASVAVWDTQADAIASAPERAKSRRQRFSCCRPRGVTLTVTRSI